MRPIAPSQPKDGHVGGEGCHGAGFGGSVFRRALLTASRPDRNLHGAPICGHLPTVNSRSVGVEEEFLLVEPAVCRK
jgi:hypothetical protein